MNQDSSKFQRQRQLLLSLISFCSLIIFFGSFYIIFKITPSDDAIISTPEIYIDPQNKNSELTITEEEPHSEPTAPDNTAAPITPPSEDNTSAVTPPQNQSAPPSSTQSNLTPQTPSTSTPTITESPQPQPQPQSQTPSTNSQATEVTQAVKNDTYRQLIESTYQLKLKYGNENGNYAPINDRVPTKIYDDDTIAQFLRVIDSALSLYPKGFFQEMHSNGMTLNLYLVRTIGDNITGLTEAWSNGYTTITLQTDDGEEFASTIHHEFMHYIDAYLVYMRHQNNVDYSLNAFNPEGFSYGDTSSREYVFTGRNALESYFTTVYSKTSVAEDRAEIFSDLIVRGSCPSYYSKGAPINEKARTIANEIESNFTTVQANTTEFWERCIAN